MKNRKPDKNNYKKREKVLNSNKKILKFEHPARIAELDPENTLKRVGFKEGMTLCDIGAGTGIFSFAAAEISRNPIFALDISDEMIRILGKRKAERKIENLIIKKVEYSDLPIDSESCDFALMITVLHELEEPNIMMQEIKRVLKKGGKLFVIEFYKKKSLTGPPFDHRISEEKVDELWEENGFKKIEKFKMSENFYGVVLKI